jgi:hypothetical protein
MPDFDRFADNTAGKPIVLLARRSPAATVASSIVQVAERVGGAEKTPKGRKTSGNLQVAENLD